MTSPQEHQVFFHGVQLKTMPGKVMVPRPSTEALVSEAVALISDQQLRVADVGTGAGTIACLVAACCPNVRVVAADTNPYALELAAENSRRLGVGRRVEIVYSRLLDQLDGPFDVVLANLPYLPKHTPDPRYQNEPPDAIYGEGPDGYALYRALIAACKTKLAPRGTLIIQLHGKPLSARHQELDRLAALFAMSENGHPDRISSDTFTG